MNEYHLLTQIKNDVENKRIKKYQHIKQKSNAKYYELYLNKIIFIQKSWRKHLIRRGLVLQQMSLKQLKKNIQNRQKNEFLKNHLFLLKKQRLSLQNFDPNDQQAFYGKQLQKQLKSSLKNVFEGADRFAKIKAVLKNQMMSYQQIVKQNEGLKKSCQDNSFESQCLKQKNRQLSEKIKALKSKISDQKTQILLLKEKNNQIFNFLPLNL